jgi:hypothetical protein
MDIITFVVQQWVNSLQSLVDVLYIPLSFIGVHAPPVASWLQPFFPGVH